MKLHWSLLHVMLQWLRHCCGCFKLMCFCKLCLNLLHIVHLNKEGVDDVCLPVNFIPSLFWWIFTMECFVLLWYWFCGFCCFVSRGRVSIVTRDFCEDVWFVA